MRRTLHAAVLAAALLATPRAPAEPEAAGPVTGLQLLGRCVLARDLTVDGTVVGGLSGLAYDREADRYWALSDDRGARGYARAYRLRIDPNPTADGARLDAGSVTVEAVHRLLDLEGRPFPPAGLDPEGIAKAPDGFYLSSEGVSKNGIPAFVAKLGPDGRVVRQLPLPARYLPGDGRGVRDNLGFESLALTPDRSVLFAGLENALEQDGPAASPGTRSPARILRFDLARGARLAEYVYPVEPVSASSTSPDGILLNGLSDLLPLDGERLLALERQYVEGVGNSVRVYEVSLEGATDVSALDSLSATEWTPAKKSLLLDLAELGIPPANFEGMTFGPVLPDGRQSLVLVTDDNFNPRQEATTFVLLAVDRTPVTVSRIQGAGHRSPLEGRWVTGIAGTVTALDEDKRSPGFWVESREPDADARTSEGLRVTCPAGMLPRAGQAVLLSGFVEEAAQGKGLPVTRLRATRVDTSGPAPALPPPVSLFDGLPVPSRVDDDGLTAFEPGQDALDLWESLEGMRVRVPGGTVVGPTASYGELALLPDGPPAGARTRAGGLLFSPGDPLVEPVRMGRKLAGKVPDLDVGSRLAGPIEGVVDYDFSSYKVLPVSQLAVASEAAAGEATTSLAGDARRLTIATFNVENLSVAGDPARFGQLGEVISRRLRGPDVLALEEVQDDSGRTAGDGVVSSRATLDALVGGIAAAGGPRYEAVWIDPVPDREGGQPGGNIRVALLLRSGRVELVRRGSAGPLDATEPLGEGRNLHLGLSPGRVAPRSAAFDLTEGEGVRRSLAVELRFAGKPLFVVVNHWSSKSDDDRPYGGTQPPRAPTAARRLAQAREVRGFAERLLRADPRARVVVLGDLNDTEHSEPVRHLSALPFENLVLRVPEAARYSFNFGGVSALLDHVVVSPELSRAAEVEVVHVNADRADSRRSSDHDPVVARLLVR